MLFKIELILLKGIEITLLIPLIRLLTIFLNTLEIPSAIPEKIFPPLENNLRILFHTVLTIPTSESQIDLKMFLTDSQAPFQLPLNTLLIKSMMLLKITVAPAATSYTMS